MPRHTHTFGRILSASQLPYFQLRPPHDYGVLTTTGHKTGKRRSRWHRGGEPAEKAGEGVGHHPHDDVGAPFVLSEPACPLADSPGKNATPTANMKTRSNSLRIGNSAGDASM